VIRAAWLALLLVLLLAAACDDGDGGPGFVPGTASPETATGTASPANSQQPTASSPSPANSPSPSPTAAVELVEGGPVPLPEGLVLYYYGGRVPIEGAVPLPVLRARQAEGGLEIYELSANFPKGGAYTAQYEFELGRLAFGICTRGYCGGYGPADADSQNELFVSSDGGVRWESLGPLPTNAFPAAILEDGTLIVSQFDPATNTGNLLTWPEARRLEPPVAGARPQLFGRDLHWVNEEGEVFDERGNLVRAAPRFPPGEFSAIPAGVLDLIWWIPLPRDSSGTGYVSEIAPDGTLGRTVTHHGFDLDVIGRIDDDRVLVRRYFPPQGGIGATYILDMRDGSFREVAGLRRDGDVDAYPVAVVRGTFVRVDAPGDCLNLRAGRGTDSPIVSCVADGVLLEPTGDAVTAQDGSRWRPVRTPSGETGFASVDFLR
jgi:hypothetical protein